MKRGRSCRAVLYRPWVLFAGAIAYVNVCLPSEYTQSGNDQFLEYGIFHHDGKICPAWWGWGLHAHPTPFSLLPSHTKLQCTLLPSVQIMSPCFISTSICTQWFDSCPPPPPPPAGHCDNLHTPVWYVPYPLEGVHLIFIHIGALSFRVFISVVRLLQRECLTS